MSTDSTLEAEIADGYKIKRIHKTTDIFSLDEAKGVIPVYKVTCFPVKALAEPSKFLMKYGGIDFEDDNCDYDLKSTQFGTEILSYNKRAYHQNVAVARFFAKQVKLSGRDDLEDFEIDSIVDSINDLRMLISLYYYEQDPDIKTSKKAKLLEETIPLYMERLDKLADNNDGYLACKRLTWADMYFVSLLDYLNAMSGIKLIGDYENLIKVRINVLSLPAIHEWMKNRPNMKY